MLTNNNNVLSWIKEMQNLCSPKEVVWIDGSNEQLDQLKKKAFETK